MERKNDARFGPLFGGSRGWLKAAHPRHADIHQHDVRVVLPAQVDRFGGVPGFSGDFEVGLRREQGADPCRNIA